MEKSNRILSHLLCLVMLLTLFPTGVFAETDDATTAIVQGDISQQSSPVVKASLQEEGKISISNGTGNPGDTVSLDLYVDQNPGIMFISITPSYDTAVLELVKMQGVGSGWTIGTKAIWDSDGDKTFTGKTLTLTFKIKENAYGGETTVRATIWAANADEKQVTFGVSSGVITIAGDPPPVMCTMTFDANGGRNAPASQTIPQYETLFLPAAYPNYEGHLFLGWSTYSTAQEAESQPGEMYALTSDMTLYAVWLDLSEPDFKLPASLQNIEDEAFAGTAVRYAVLPENLNEIGSHIFAECTHLAAVYAPALVTSIQADAFSDTPAPLVLLGQLGSAIISFAEEHGFRFETVEVNF